MTVPTGQVDMKNAILLSLLLLLYVRLRYYFILRKRCEKVLVEGLRFAMIGHCRRRGSDSSQRDLVHAIVLHTCRILLIWKKLVFAIILAFI